MTNYIATHGRTIAWDFAQFDERNPKIYELFKRFAMQAIANKKKTSSKLIINRIRWEVFITTDSTDDYKINDAFTAHYARKYINEFPQYEKYFELRTLRSL